MSRLLCPSLLICATLGGATLTAAEGSNMVVAQPPAAALPDAADLITWPEKPYHHFVAGSVVNALGWLGDGQPAGAHGGVRTDEDGGLTTADGQPLRIWGTTLAFGATFPDSDADIERMADAIAAMGYNAVRFHHNDWGSGSVSFLKQGSVIELDPKKIDVFDKVMKAMIDRGIYIYVDLVDSRDWSAEMGIENWEELKAGKGWKGVFPMPGMLGAWQKATDALMTHVNPYTGRSFADEPAVVAVEILNENGPFWDWSHVTTPTVRAWFDSAWNAWLQERYGSRAALAAAWTDVDGVCGLFDDEDPAQGNVYRPQWQKMNQWQRSNRSKARGACRYNDLVQFYREITTTFYQQASAHLRELGYQGPIIGSHELRGAQNQLAEVEGTGTIAAHLYGGEAIAWGTRPGVSGVKVDGVDVRSSNWFVNVARIAVDGASGWNTEWTAGGLSYRADAHLSIAAMMAYQELDASMHFSWSHRWSGQRMNSHDKTYDYIEWRKKVHKSFDTHQDSVTMAAHRICAAILRRGDMPAARYTVHIAQSSEDAMEQNLHAPGLEGGGGTVGNAALFLPMLHRMETHFFDQAYTGDADVVFSTGRSASGDYRQAKHAVVLGDNAWCDHQHKRRDLAAPARLLHPDLQTADLDQPVTFTVSFGYDAAQTVAFAKLEAAILADSIPAGATAIGRSADGRYTLGWLDDRRLVLPTAGQYQAAANDPRWLFRFYLQAAQRWGIALPGNGVDESRYVSDNGALITDWGTGTQIVDTPRSQVVAGFIGYNQTHETGNLSVSLLRPYGNIALTSCSDATIAASRRLFLVAAGRLQNTGMTYENKNGSVRQTKTGKAPILVEGLHGSLALSGLQHDDLIVYALDNEGRRIGQVPVERSPGGLAFTLNPAWQTIWFEIAGPEVDAPSREPEVWPGEQVPAPQRIAPESLSVAAYVDLLRTPAQPVVAETTQGNNRVPLFSMATLKKFQVYGNLKASVGTVGDDDCAELVLGQHNDKDWHAGMWFQFKPAPGLKADDCTGISFFFQGDGTLPRDCNVNLEWVDAAGTKHKAKSRNLHQIFERTDWQEVVLGAEDFPKAEGLDFSAIERADFSVVSNLISSRHNAKLGDLQLVTVDGAADTAVIEDIGADLPAIADLPTPTLRIPWVGDAAISADGLPDEAAWQQAIAVAIDEESVPSWHQIGTVIASGQITRGEKARVWLLGTPAGLAAIIDVDKGGVPPVNERTNWWEGDCVELFSDADPANPKPSKQLFFAYERKAIKRACSSAESASVGRVKTTRGYALELLVPWHELGLSGDRSEPFGLDLQIDVAAPGAGKVLQLSLGTGTNEAYFTSERYLSATLVR